MAELLTGNAAALAGDRQQDLATYARDRQRAESDLQQVAVTAAADPAAQQAVSSVLDALGRYEALAADAILLNQRGRDPAGSSSAGTLGYYRQATDLMRTAVLPAAEALTSSNASSLDAAYRQDRSGAREGRLLVLAIGLAVTAALIELQVFLARRYRRLINPALAAATLLACGLAIAGAVQLDAQANYLKVAKQDAFDSILALTRARAVSYDANADETRYLVDPARAGRYQDSFLDKSQRLADVGNVGIQGYDAALATDISAYQANHADVRFGGYLGTEFRNITFTGEPAAAIKALLAYQVYERDDRRLRALAAGDGAMTGGNGASGVGATASGGRQRLGQAIAFDIGTSPGQSDWAFSNWDAALGSLIAINEKAFTAATTAGTRTGSGWTRVVPAVGTAVIVGLTVAGAWRRIGEYRLPFGKAGYTPAVCPVRTSMPPSGRGSVTCWTSSVLTRRLCSRRGRPAISPRILSCASATVSPAPGSSCPARGAASPSGGKERSRAGTSPGLSPRSGPGRREVSSASDGCAGSRASTSSTSTMRTSAEPTAVVPGPASRAWTRRCGATSAADPGTSRGVCAVRVSSFSGPGPLAPSGPGGGNLPRASPDLRASCCSTCSAARTRRRSR
jgi:hypothetical protein